MLNQLSPAEQQAEPPPITARPAINPIYTTHGWPWPRLYFKDRIACSDRIYEVQKDDSFKVIFKFTKKFLKALKRSKLEQTQAS